MGNVDAVLGDHDKLDALNNDPSTPANVVSYLNAAAQTEVYLDGVDFERDSDGDAYRVVPRQEGAVAGPGAGTSDALNPAGPAPASDARGNENPQAPAGDPLAGPGNAGPQASAGEGDGANNG